MAIIGIGTDIVNIERIRKIYRRFGNHFLNKNFHPLEIKALEIKTSEIKISQDITEDHKISYMAKRFAGKEAVAKAFGRGIGKLSFKDIAILNDEFGAPYVQIDPSNQVGDVKIHISLSDDHPFAVAFVVIHTAS